MDFKNRKSISLQIADRLCDEIMLNTFKEGERIPSVREYAVKLEVNVNTIVKSFDLLSSDGILFKKRGLGYFVNEDACASIGRMRRKEFIEKDLPEFFRKMNLLKITMDEIKELYGKQ